MNNYILKGIRANICSNSWAGPGNISVCGKRVINNGVTVWSQNLNHRVKS
jgi:hypothetical protein